jgi:hypothetical protein
LTFAIDLSGLERLRTFGELARRVEELKRAQ